MHWDLLCAWTPTVAWCNSYFIFFCICCCFKWEMSGLSLQNHLSSSPISAQFQTQWPSRWPGDACCFKTRVQSASLNTHDIVVSSCLFRGPPPQKKDSISQFSMFCISFNIVSICMNGIELNVGMELSWTLIIIFVVGLNCCGRLHELH